MFTAVHQILCAMIPSQSHFIYAEIGGLRCTQVLQWNQMDRMLAQVVRYLEQMYAANKAMLHTRYLMLMSAANL